MATRSIEPRRPKISPAAKSTTRLASAGSMAVRLTMTGTPSRKSSPMARASRKLSGVTVAIRRSCCSAVSAATCTRGSVTQAWLPVPVSVPSAYSSS
ncbi:hypothetical protein SMICM17S_00164 [Streptomyces microflavus]